MNSNSLNYRILLSDKYDSIENPYIFEADGYFSLYSGSSLGDVATAYIASSNSNGSVYLVAICTKDGTSDIRNIFVKKGMLFYTTGKNTEAYIRYLV